MTTYYIYTLSCKQTKHPFYVGITQNPDWRFRAHTGTKSPTYDRIKVLNGNVEIEVLDSIELPKAKGLRIPLAARKLEEYWIQQLLQWGFVLVNKKRNTVDPHPFVRKDKSPFKIAA